MRTGIACSDPLGFCRSGNVMFLSGTSWVHTGGFSVTGMWSVSAVDGPILPMTGIDTVSLRVDRPGGVSPSWYSLDLSTEGVGVPFGPGVYERASRHPFATRRGEPGLALTSTGRGCNRVSGRFEVHRWEIRPDGTVLLEAAFHHYCETTMLVTGCVRYEGPLAGP